MWLKFQKNNKKEEMHDVKEISTLGFLEIHKVDTSFHDSYSLSDFFGKTGTHQDR